MRSNEDLKKYISHSTRPEGALVLRTGLDGCSFPGSMCVCCVKLTLSSKYRWQSLKGNISQWEF